MRKELPKVTRITNEITGTLTSGESVRYTCTRTKGETPKCVYASVTRDGRQVLSVNYQPNGQVNYSLSNGEDLKSMGAVIDEVLSDVNDIYNDAIAEETMISVEGGMNLEGMKIAVEEGVVTGITNEKK